VNFFGLEISRKARTLTIDQIINRLAALHETTSGIAVTPENCMESPTVHAVVTAVSRRIATLPVHVIRQRTSDGRTVKEKQPNHPVEALLNNPNSWQNRVTYWLDAVSWLLRHGNHYAFMAQGGTGPVRRLESIPAGHVQPLQDDELNVLYRVQLAGGATQDMTPQEIHHVRGPARNGIAGDSPVTDVRESIALEIAAERFGGSLFGNGAMPGIVFAFADGFAGFRSDAERNQFAEDFHEKFGRSRRFRSLVLPKGMKIEDSVPVENDKAQFLETRKYQRTVIAGAFGVPPHLVGDLERGTFNNVEQQSIEFVLGVVLPYVRMFEAAMERDLLSEQDRRAGIKIRFNLDGALRGDFKTRQEGLKIQREAGVINPNEWREAENMNPIDDDDGGETYWREGPSGQGLTSDDDGSDGSEN